MKQDNNCSISTKSKTSFSRSLSDSFISSINKRNSLIYDKDNKLFSNKIYRNKSSIDLIKSSIYTKYYSNSCCSYVQFLDFPDDSNDDSLNISISEDLYDNLKESDIKIKNKKIIKKSYSSKSLFNKQAVYNLINLYNDSKKKYKLNNSSTDLCCTTLNNNKLTENKSKSLFGLYDISDIYLTNSFIELENYVNNNCIYQKNIGDLLSDIIFEIIGNKQVTINNNYQNYKNFLDNINNLIICLDKNKILCNIYSDTDQEKYVFYSLQIIKKMKFLFTSKEYNLHLNQLKNNISFINYKSYNKIYTLVIDLDETLICSEQLSNSNNNNINFDIIIENINYGLFIRPFMFEFLEYCYNFFNLILFSAGERYYVNSIVNYLNIKKYFSCILTKEYCININNIYIKDLSILKDYDENKTIIIDNNLLSFSNNIKQGLLISNFYDDKDDKELLLSMHYLENLLNDTDNNSSIVNANSNNFGFESILNNI